MVQCAVLGCKQKSNKTKDHYFRLPKVNKHLKKCDTREIQDLQKKRRESWLKVLNRSDLIKKELNDPNTTGDVRVCSKHFIEGRPACITDIESPDWVPSQNLGYMTPKRFTINSIDRFERAKRRSEGIKEAPPRKRMKKHKESQIIEEEMEGISVYTDVYLDNIMNDDYIEMEKTIKDTYVQTENILNDAYVQTDNILNDAYVQTDNILNDAYVQTDFSRNDIGVQTDLTRNDIKAMECELINLLEQKLKAEEELKVLKFCSEDLEKKPKKVKYFTGLPNIAVFMLILNEIQHFLETKKKESLKPFQKLFLTLMKLRLNSSYRGLGYRFNITPVTAARIFKKTIDILQKRFTNLVYWPTREELRATMPECFRSSFGTSVAVIIDCFEIFTEKPSNFEARAQTWSSYKHHNTVKYLIGITPQGVISFISEGWGGRVSDKHLTIESGLLEKLLPHDIVLADRGFTISDQVGFYYAELKIPAFTKGKCQLHPKDIEDTRKIAAVRIHVERVIGTVRMRFKITSGPVPTEMMADRSEDGMSLLDKIVRVCCALNNMCDFVVPLA